LRWRKVTADLQIISKELCMPDDCDRPAETRQYCRYLPEHGGNPGTQCCLGREVVE